MHHCTCIQLIVPIKIPFKTHWSRHRLRVHKPKYYPHLLGYQQGNNSKILSSAATTDHPGSVIASISLSGQHKESCPHVLWHTSKDSGFLCFVEVEMSNCASATVTHHVSLSHNIAFSYPMEHRTGLRKILCLCHVWQECEAYFIPVRLSTPVQLAYNGEPCAHPQAESHNVDSVQHKVHTWSEQVICSLPSMLGQGDQINWSSGLRKG